MELEIVSDTILNKILLSYRLQGSFLVIFRSKSFQKIRKSVRADNWPIYKTDKDHRSYQNNLMFKLYNFLSSIALPIIESFA